MCKSATHSAKRKRLTVDDPRLMTLWAAIDYHNLGIPTIPIQRETKKPAVKWKPYQTQCPTLDELVAFFGQWPRNLALCTGVFSGLVIVDTDNVAGQAWVEMHLPPTSVRVRTGSGGVHFYYKHPGGHVKTRTRIAGDPAIGVDIRADGGYALAPPSVHPRTQQPYIWIDQDVRQLELTL